MRVVSLDEDAPLSPRERRFVIRAKASPERAIGRVAALLDRRRPDPEEARARAASLLRPFGPHRPSPQSVSGSPPWSVSMA